MSKNHFFKDISALFDKIEVTSTEGRALDIARAVEDMSSRLKSLKGSGNKVMIIGNGASAAIASHTAADFLKNGRIPACVFSDPALLTCLSNDIGYESVFAFPVKIHAHKGDVLFAISSSGKSPNILKAVSAASEMGCFIVTLSGFDKDNPLRCMGSLNFYVPSQRYGEVEVIHHAICHRIADTL